MSKNFLKVKEFFDNHFWTVEMVRNSVVKGWITEDEFFEITKENYN